jgi:hypothetical protein
VSESVVAFTLIKWDGSEVLCSRGADGEAGELFGLALGGYGMFGIIAEATMKVNANVHLTTEMLQCRLEDFTVIYEELLKDSAGDIEVKMARLDITNRRNVDLFVFRRAGLPGMRTVSKLNPEPNKMGLVSQVLYKWAMPHIKEARYAVERAMGKAVDVNTSSERNQLMFESAEPLARLYSPLFMMNDTFVLQEYFVPRENFHKWMAMSARGFKMAQDLEDIEMLNTTIRFVHPDSDTALPYSKGASGSYAFVLYFRLHRTIVADEQLRQVHAALVPPTLELGGTFYLPYRHHYSRAEMDHAYPEARSFFAQKTHYDPKGLFTSQWFERYGRRFVSDATAQIAPPMASGSVVMARLSTTLGSMASGSPEVSIRRTNSFKTLMSNPQLRHQFKNQFLTTIFNLEDNTSLFNSMCLVASDPRNVDDVSCFQALQSLLATSNGPVAAATRVWKQIKQLHDQKRELVRETASVISQLGRSGRIDGYVSCGDNGKLVIDLRRALQLTGAVYIVHDENPDEEDVEETPGCSTMDGGGSCSAELVPPSKPSLRRTPSSSIPSHRGTSGSTPELGQVLERGSIGPVGTFVRMDYLENAIFSAVPSSSCDLFTMNQGLHHIPLDQLPRFLKEVFRVLRPNGLFVFREHDCTEGLLPMCDMAHLVFNAGGFLFLKARWCAYLLLLLLFTNVII